MLTVIIHAQAEINILALPLIGKVDCILHQKAPAKQLAPRHGIRQNAPVRIRDETFLKLSLHITDIAADHKIKIPLLHLGQVGFHVIAFDVIVAVHKADILSLCLKDRSGTAPSLPHILLILQNTKLVRILFPVLLKDRQAAIRRTVVDTYDLIVRYRLGKQTVQTSPEIFFHIINRYDTTHLWHNNLTFLSLPALKCLQAQTLRDYSLVIFRCSGIKLHKQLCDPLRPETAENLILIIVSGIRCLKQLRGLV